MIQSSSSSQHLRYQGKFSAGVPHARSSSPAIVSSNGSAVADKTGCETEIPASSSSKPMEILAPDPTKESKNVLPKGEPPKPEFAVGKVPDEAEGLMDNEPSSATFASKTSEKECIDPTQNKMGSTIEPKDHATENSSTKKTVSMKEIHGKGVSVMSPITMCFERMLGAGEYLCVVVMFL
jgi:hypothetical protein